MHDWMPTAYTPSLTGTEDFITDGDRLIRVIEKYWREQDVEGQFVLDEWQKWLLRHLLERYPADWPVEELRGRLRFRQSLVSMGRQNGKSILGAILGVYGLLFHEYAPAVIGVAYSAKTAQVVYDRVGYTLANVPQFKKQVKVTKTSGIRRLKTPGSYIIKPNSDKAVQGFPMTLCIYDEVHITTEKLWSAAKQGTKTKKDGMVIGLTTAGDDQSHLLKNLYKEGEKAIANQDDETLQRFGFFLWEAPEGSDLSSDEAIMAANPAVACGRVSLRTVRSDAATDPKPEQDRYVLNRFVASLNNWIPMNAWNACAGGEVCTDAGCTKGRHKHSVIKQGPVIYAVDRTANWEYATITVTQKRDGRLYTEIVARIIKPNLEQLIRICTKLRQRSPGAVFTMENALMPDLNNELRNRGFKTFALTASELAAACQTAYALIIQGRMEHPDEDLLKMQMPRAVRKNYGDVWRVSRKDSSVEIDGVMATIMGLYLAETQRKPEVQLFI